MKLSAARDVMLNTVQRTMSAIQTGRQASTLPVPDTHVTAKVVDAALHQMLPKVVQPGHLVRALESYHDHGAIPVGKLDALYAQAVNQLVSLYPHNDSLSLRVLRGASCGVSVLNSVHLTQSNIDDAIAATQPAVMRFLKYAPIYGYRILNNFEDIPAVIRRYLGDIDRSYYDSRWFQWNSGSAVVMQMDDYQPGFFLEELDQLITGYEEVGEAELVVHNQEYAQRLRGLIGMAPVIDCDPRVFALLRMRPTTAYRFDDVFAVDENTSLEVSMSAGGGFATQAIAAGQAAYIVNEPLAYDDAGEVTAHDYHVVGWGDLGQPVGYIRMKFNS